MSRNKLVRFAQNEVNPNVVQAGKPIFEQIKGQWNALQFANDQPLVVELACGRGEFTLGLGRQYPNQNFIGVDIKGSRIWKGSSSATAEGIHTVAFLRTQIQQLQDFFAAGEISELWITFPDPRLRDRDEKRRLTFHTFLNRYKRILKPGGVLHLKTDSLPFFEFSEGSLVENDWEIIAKTNDLYTSEWMDDHYGIKTRFEEMFYEKGFNINYLRATNTK